MPAKTPVSPQRLSGERRKRKTTDLMERSALMPLPYELVRVASARSCRQGVRAPYPLVPLAA
eukprot:scaffold8125_cov18-Prasinocladus_malaysianus.AAC.1